MVRESVASKRTGRLTLSTEAISELESRSVNTSPFSLTLPPARSIASLWPQSEAAIALPHGCQTDINSPAHAYMFALHLSQISALDDTWRDQTRRRLQKLLWPLQRDLETTCQWDLAIEMLLHEPQGLPIVRATCNRAAKLKLPAGTQRHLALALVRVLSENTYLARDLILPSLEVLAASEAFSLMEEDLSFAVATWLWRFLPQRDLPEHIHALGEALRQDNVMTDGELQTAFRRLSIAQCEPSSRPRRKRRKLDVTNTTDAAPMLAHRVTKLLTRIETEDLDTLPGLAPTVYPSLSDEQQSEAWYLLRQLSALDHGIAVLTMTRLMALDVFKLSKRPRVAAMFAIQACVQQSNTAAELALQESPFGQLCLSSLHSSIRELRVAAGHCLPCFVRDGLPNNLTTQNRHIAMEYLRSLSDQDVACEQETLIGAWARVALVCGERELNLVLLRLVDYLGHANSLINAVASAELEGLAAANNQTLDELLRPFWSSVAVSVVQDINARPQKAQQLCDLLGLEVNELLVRTQRETVPTMVLTKKRDVLQRIAFARKTSVQDLCLQPRTNLAATLALLLGQGSADVEEAAMDCLSAAAPDLQGTDLGNLVKIDSVLVACEMLKRSGDVPEDRKSRAYHAFHTFTNLAGRKPGHSKAHSKSSRTLAEFFDSHILGIMTHFSEIMENSQSTIPEKMRCVRALADMIALTKTHAGVAMPQIRACLRSAMEQPDLIETAFSAWLALLSVVDTDDIAAMLDETFALVVQYWPHFSPILQTQVHDKISFLLRHHNKLVQDNIMTLPLLPGIPLLSKLSAEIERIRAAESIENHCKAYALRIQDESNAVVLQALDELVSWLEAHRDSIHDMAISEQPSTPLSELMRALLDATLKHSSSTKASDLCARALGVIGCLDPDRVEANRKKRQVIVLSNFDRANEVVEWAIALLEDVLVNAFKSSTNSRAQGFLAYVLQELLHFCGFNEVAALRPRTSQAETGQQRWSQMAEHVRITLTPFLSSRYVITSNAQSKPLDRTYPGFSADQSHAAWLHSLVYDLMWKAKGDNAKMVFPLLARVIRSHDLAVASWLLPYAILNVVLGGTVNEIQGISSEMLAVLQCQTASSDLPDNIKLCSSSVFAVLDYMTLWLQEKKKSLGETRASAFRTGNTPSDFNESQDMAQIDEVERFLTGIPAAAIASRARDCGAYARALFHWEEFIRQHRSIVPSQQLGENEEEVYETLHSLYALIDEPDGLEGLGSHLNFLTEEQQVLQHTKAGRWTAAQAWYEMQLSSDPSDTRIQTCLLNCLQETGQFAPMLRYANGFLASTDTSSKSDIVPYVLEAQWMTGDLAGMRGALASLSSTDVSDFKGGLSKLILLVADGDTENAACHTLQMRKTITQRLDRNGTDSLQGCHDDLKRLHILHEVEALGKCSADGAELLLGDLDRRLAVLGSYNHDKLDVLGVRRALMRLRSEVFALPAVGSSWLATARLARKANNIPSAYNAVLQAYGCGDRAAKMEEAKLLWHDGHQRQAIQALEAAIDSGIFDRPDSQDESHGSEVNRKTNMLAARAYLTLTKWLDASGQNQSKDMTTKFQHAAKTFQKWEKGHYYLGRHYNKLLEAEKALPKAQQSPVFLSGEITRLTIENLLRALPFGAKYWHQSIPKIITLWLDLGNETLQKAPKEDHSVFDKRVQALRQVNKQLQKYYERIPAYVFYTALPQLVSRITHENADVWKQLCNMLTRIAMIHPTQALWSLFAVIKAKSRNRVARGEEVLNRLKDPKRARSEHDAIDLRSLISHGQKLSDGLLQACEAPVEDKASHVSLARDLGFNHKLAPSKLVVPTEATLIANLPVDADSDKIRKHRAFAYEKVTIQSFADDVLVLSSLQRPRKIVVRGSDGKQYGLLCKPKDDLRKDQRLMEFNGIINRALKRDAESSKRRLYIKTYAVTPLSEESGTIEWVEGIKPTRDILLAIYLRKGVRPMYHELRTDLNEACSSPDKLHIFEDKVLSQFPPVLHEWFTETYSDPETWFAARLRYARSAAVMSITGHVLGLGDRHGENLLLEESTGGVFHVDFNCLFDKGLTFEKPELVPFRLTHNMVDAMGAYGYEGPFRKSCELTLGQLRQNKDTLMTVLETFLYDPTTDFVGKKKRTTPGVPETPQEILDSVAAKLKGLLRGETVPLSTEGYVDALIRDAVSHHNLASMYIGKSA